jgi:hypothetical protein
MMGKLEPAIAAEIGVDDGRELPYIPLVAWGLTGSADPPDLPMPTRRV